MVSAVLTALASSVSNPAVYLAVSENGRLWRVLDQPVARMARFPDAVVLHKAGTLGARNEILLYFVDADTRKIVLSRSSNGGVSWSDRKNISIEHSGGPPSVIVAPDGTLRMYLSESKGIALFQSKNGSEFERVTLALECAGASLPEVVYSNGKWLMYFVLNGETRCAESQDGVGFTMDEGFRFRSSGRAGAYMASADTLRVFFSGDGIWSRIRRADGSFANESGYHLTPEPGTQISNPSPLLFAGARHFLFCEVAWTAPN